MWGGNGECRTSECGGLDHCLFQNLNIGEIFWKLY